VKSKKQTNKGKNEATANPRQEYKKQREKLISKRDRKERKKRWTKKEDGHRQTNKHTHLTPETLM